jgi:hypothetical protein
MVRRALLTILSTECVQNHRNRFIDGRSFPPQEQHIALPNFSALRKMPLKSMVLPGVNRLAHNLIHTLCAKLCWRWKSTVLPGNLAVKTLVSIPCCIFTHGNKNDINQCTWRLSVRLHTILSTDCVQNFDGHAAA